MDDLVNILYARSWVVLRDWQLPHFTNYNTHQFSVLKRLKSSLRVICKCYVENGKTFQGPKGGAHVEIENALVNIVKERCAQGLPISRGMIKKIAQDKANAQNMQNFEAPDGWCDIFIQRRSTEIEVDPILNFLYFLNSLVHFLCVLYYYAKLESLFGVAL